MITMTTSTTTTTRTVHQTTFDLNEFSCIQVDGFCVRAFCVVGFLVASSPSCSLCPLLLMLSFELPQHQVKLHRNYASTGLYGVLKCSFVFYTFYQHQHHPFIRRWWMRKNPFLVLFGFAHFFLSSYRCEAVFISHDFALTVGCDNLLGVQAHTHSKQWQVRDTIRRQNRLPILMDQKNSICFSFSFWQRIGIVQCQFFGIRFGSFGL